MAKQIFRFLLAVLLAGPLNFGQPARPAAACTQPVGGHPVYSITERTEAAGVVVEGTVISVEGDPHYDQIALVRVHQYLKGSGPPTIRIIGFGTSALCLSSAYPGLHAIFFTRSPDGSLFGGRRVLTTTPTPPAPPPLYRANYLSAGDAIAPATEENIAEALAASGQEPFIWRYLYLPIIFKN